MVNENGNEREKGWMEKLNESLTTSLLLKSSVEQLTLRDCWDGTQWNTEERNTGLKYVKINGA